jgi:ABC-2 type transport system ATP-binding protein
MLEVLSLNKNYASYRALSDLSFAVARGEVVGFLGPNGAGKTTTLRIIAGFLAPSAGQVKLDGISVHLEPVRARRLLGYMPEDCPYYPELRVREYLDFRARLKGVSGRDCRRAIERSASLVRIDDRLESLVGNLSKGYRQRLGLADALIANPPLLILDEPTSGLDPNQIRDVRTVLKDLSEEHTVLLSTHILAEVEQTCQRALVIHRGRLVAENTISRSGTRSICTEFGSFAPAFGTRVEPLAPANRDCIGQAG